MADGIVVVGGAGFGRETLDVIEAVNGAAAAPAWYIMGISDDSPAERTIERLAARGYNHLGTSDHVLSTMAPASYVVGIGDPEIRRRIAADFDAAGWVAATLVHPSANVGSAVSIGPGSVVCGGVQLSTNTRLGSHVHLNPGSIVGHDSVLGDFASVNPGAVVSGEVIVGKSVLIGAGAVILQGLDIGHGSVIGASACVTRSIERGRTVVGIPARPLERSGAMG